MDSTRDLPPPPSSFSPWFFLSFVLTFALLAQHFMNQKAAKDLLIRKELELRAK
jgi:hypothetical protein